VKLDWAHLCDWAGPGENGKNIVVGIFDACYVSRKTPADSIATPSCYLALRFSATSVAGNRHLLSPKLIDPDGKVMWEGEYPISFGERVDGLGQHAYVYAWLGSVAVPDYGNYEWAFYVDGLRVGETAIALLPPKA
jgi:hypothetical protein